MNLNDKPDNKRKIDQYLRFTNIAFEMLAIMGAGTFAGYKIDQWMHNRFYLFTLILMVLSVIGAIINVIRKLNSK